MHYSAIYPYWELWCLHSILIFYSYIFKGNSQRPDKILVNLTLDECLPGWKIKTDPLLQRNLYLIKLNRGGGGGAGYNLQGDSGVKPSCLPAASRMTESVFPPRHRHKSAARRLGGPASPRRARRVTVQVAWVNLRLHNTFQSACPSCCLLSGSKRCAAAPPAGPQWSGSLMGPEFTGTQWVNPLKVTPSSFICQVEFTHLDWAQINL